MPEKGVFVSSLSSAACKRWILQNLSYFFKGNFKLEKYGVKIGDWFGLLRIFLGFTFFIIQIVHSNV